MSINGNGLRNVLVGLLIAVVAGGVSWAWTALATRVDTVQATQANRGERIAKLETEIVTLKASLERIEKKLDEALALRR